MPAASIVAFTDPWFLGQRVSVGVDLFGQQTFANSNQSFNTSFYGAKFDRRHAAQR